jgi:hypothetical protein
MSSMLEQAIVDAETLKEAALKNAEVSIIEKYSAEIKDAVEHLLEQELGAEEEPMPGMPGMEGDEPGMEGEADEMLKDIPAAAHDEMELCPCPDKADSGSENSMVVVDFDELYQQMKDEEELESHEEVAADVLPPDEDEIGTAPALEEGAVLDVDEENLAQILEKLKVDIEPTPSGWGNNGYPNSLRKIAQEELLAAMQDTERKEQEEALEKAVKDLTVVNESLKNDNEKFQNNLSELKNKNDILKEAVLALNEKLKETNLANAKLLYTNKALVNNSLNERQKNKIVESLSKSKTVEEAKVIFDTLQSTVGSTFRKQPKSLSEAVNRNSSMTMPKNKRKKTVVESNHTLNRWQALAGINRPDNK